MPGGRPLKYQTEKELREAIDAYFAKCDEQGRPYTVSGLGYEIGLDRAQLIQYGNKDKFYNAIKEAKHKIQCFAEERLYGQNVTGVIFALKNNYGWKDRQEVDNISSDGSMTPTGPEIFSAMRASHDKTNEATED